MAGERRLYLYWDPELDGAFRRRMERALGDLKVSAADASAVDPDPENPGVTLVLVSAHGGAALPPLSDIIVQAGPGDFPHHASAFRLTTEDIETNSRRWTRLVEQLRGKLGKASLALAPEDLELRLDEMSRRAEEAERARDLVERERDEALRRTARLENDVVKLRTEATSLQAELGKMDAMNQMSAFPLASVGARYQAAVTEAREHAWQARLAAQRAIELAAQHPNALAWGKATLYSGETKNNKPHGAGVMSFLDGAGEIVASYRGEFVEGRRSGHGVGHADEGLVWSGQWLGDEASGFGLLEAPDGRRYEGEVTPGPKGAPVRGDGWLWTPDTQPPAQMKVEPRTALPAPAK
jgi:hypothetical protein